MRGLPAVVMLVGLLAGGISSGWGSMGPGENELRIWRRAGMAAPVVWVENKTSQTAEVLIQLSQLVREATSDELCSAIGQIGFDAPPSMVEQLQHQARGDVRRLLIAAPLCRIMSPLPEPERLTLLENLADEIPRSRNLALRRALSRTLLSCTSNGLPARYIPLLTEELAKPGKADESTASILGSWFRRLSVLQEEERKLLRIHRPALERVLRNEDMELSGKLGGSPDDLRVKERIRRRIRDAQAWARRKSVGEVISL